jgi:hypothetical protein
MGDVWVPAPRKAPYRCRRTGQDSPTDGPYFEESLGYCEAPGDDRELTLYHSALWLRTICESPGSPFVLLDADSHADLLAEVESLRLQLADAEANLAEREAELAEARALEGAVDKVLSNGLLERLDARYSKRPGPKPKAAA